ncbi:hypothetical protein ABBQ38_012964 [Trebouxia sp. C0009 RCD-2024]
MGGSALTATPTATDAHSCNRWSRRERNARIAASTSRTSSSTRHRKHLPLTRTRVADPGTLEQSTSSDDYDPRRQEADRSELNQLARMMPDPEEDELFDDGSSEMINPTWEYDRALFAEQGLTSHLLFPDPAPQDRFDDQYLDQDLDFDMGSDEYDYLDDPGEVDEEEVQEVTRGLEQLAYDVSARQRWEAEQAEARAITLHHEQMGRGVNKFAQTIATAKLMSDVESDRSMIGGDASNAASWVLAHFRLEDDWDEFANLVQEIEADQNHKEIQRIEDADQDLFQKTGFLDDAFESWGGTVPMSNMPYLKQSTEQEQHQEEEESVSEVQKAKSDPLLDPLLACMPGMQMGDADMEKFLQGPAATPEKVDVSSAEIDDADVPDAIAAIVDDVVLEDSSGEQDDDSDD